MMVYIENYYSKEQIKIFLTILESILRSEDKGVACINGKKVTIELLIVEDMEDEIDENS